jgi:hypothetical protein
MYDEVLTPKYDPEKWYAYFVDRIVGPYDSEDDAYYDTRGDVEWIKQGKDLLDKN